MALQQDLEASVKQMVNDLSMDELEVELGRRLKITDDEVKQKNSLRGGGDAGRT